jgi:integrase
LEDEKEQNQKDILEFLDYCGTAKQNCRETVAVRRTQLGYLSNWAGGTSFTNAPKIKESFPAYLGNLFMPNTDKRILSSTTTKATLNVGRMFFNWAINEYPERFRIIQKSWVDSLRLPRHINQSDAPKEHQYYTLDEIIRIASLTPNSLAEKRGIAAMVFMYLSGMRVGAFLTLPISCVDMAQLKIFQVPSMGVATKFHKSSITTLLNIPELLPIVKNWDAEVRKQYPPYQTWFAPIRPQRENFGHFITTDKKASPLRSKSLHKEMKELCKRAEVPFRSAHKLRHGHAMFGIKNSQNIQDLKAISQNLMHSSISITDSIYGNLTGEDFTKTISNLGNSQTEKTKEDKITDDLVRAIIKLQENPILLKNLLKD